MADRTAYWAEYYQRNRTWVRTRQGLHARALTIAKLFNGPRPPRRPAISREEHLRRRRVYNERTREDRKVARGLGVTLGEARKLLAKG